MYFWNWFFVFVSIALFSLFVYAFIALRIVSKLKNLEEPALKMAELATRLNESLEKAPDIKLVTAALDLPEGTIEKRRSALAKRRKEKKLARERRLISRFETLKFDESRLRK
jgi:uncharacterized membrane protein YedE/YeeE